MCKFIVILALLITITLIFPGCSSTPQFRPYQPSDHAKSSQAQFAECIQHYMDIEQEQWKVGYNPITNIKRVREQQKHFKECERFRR
jgi:hypothetical protein